LEIMEVEMTCRTKDKPFKFLVLVLTKYVTSGFLTRLMFRICYGESYLLKETFMF
jgi:hypothetical protein